jgi:hypothetical protein
MTIYKPLSQLAKQAAEVALPNGKGKPVFTGQIMSGNRCARDPAGCCGRNEDNMMVPSSRMDSTHCQVYSGTPRPAIALNRRVAAHERRHSGRKDR